MTQCSRNVHCGTLDELFSIFLLHRHRKDPYHIPPRFCRPRSRQLPRADIMQPRIIQLLTLFGSANNQRQSRTNCARICKTNIHLSAGYIKFKKEESETLRQAKYSNCMTPNSKRSGTWLPYSRVTTPAWRLTAYTP